MPSGVYTRRPDMEWSADEDELLCLLRSDFPRETFSRVSKTISDTFGTCRTVTACIARWHRIETLDELEVRKAMGHAEIREAKKLARVTPPPPPVLPAPKPVKPPPTPLDLKRARNAKNQRAYKARKKLAMRVPTLAELDRCRPGMR